MIFFEMGYIYFSDDHKLFSGTTTKGTFDRWLFKPIDPAEQNGISDKALRYCVCYSTFVRTYVVGILANQFYHHLDKCYRNIQRHLKQNHVTKFKITWKSSIKKKLKKFNQKIKLLLVFKCLFDIFNDLCETTNLTEKTVRWIFIPLH